MLEWLRELGSFHRIGSAVVAILPILAAACLGAFLATWLQEWLRVRREHLAAWYAVYLMVLVANETQDEIARVLQNGMFDRNPEGLHAGGPSLVDRLHQEGVLSDEAYALVGIKRSGPAGRESLQFPAYLTRWKAKVSAAYGAQ